MLWTRPRSGGSLPVYPAACRCTWSSAVMLRSGACSEGEEGPEEDLRFLEVIVGGRRVITGGCLGFGGSVMTTRLLWWVSWSYGC